MRKCLAIFFLVLFIIAQGLKHYAIVKQVYTVNNQYTVHVSNVERELDNIYVSGIEIPDASFADGNLTIPDEDIVQILLKRGILK